MKVERNDIIQPICWKTAPWSDRVDKRNTPLPPRHDSYQIAWQSHAEDNCNAEDNCIALMKKTNSKEINLLHKNN
jgi:hypothetical protein